MPHQPKLSRARSGSQLVVNISCFRLNYHLEITNADDVEKMEAEFAVALKLRGDDFKYYQDQFGEHPEERAVKNEEVILVDFYTSFPFNYIWLFSYLSNRLLRSWVK